MARLFVAVLPPEEVLDRVGALARPREEGVRYTRREQWHVTLRFLGDADVDEVAAAIPSEAPPATVRLGPEITMLGRGVAVVPVAGLEGVADAVRASTAGLGRPDDHAFRGHLTVARLRRVRRPGVVGQPIEASFPLDAVHLVESELTRTGARYVVRATVPVARRG